MTTHLILCIAEFFGFNWLPHQSIYAQLTFYYQQKYVIFFSNCLIICGVIFCCFQIYYSLWIISLLSGISFSIAKKCLYLGYISWLDVLFVLTLNLGINLLVRNGNLGRFLVADYTYRKLIQPQLNYVPIIDIATLWNLRYMLKIKGKMCWNGVIM